MKSSGLAVWLALALFGCGGGGALDGGVQQDGGPAFPDTAEGINGTGVFLETDLTLAVIDAAKRAQAAGGVTQEARDLAMLAHLRADPNVEAAGISQLNNVWARFIDGTLYMDFSGRDADFDAVRPLSSSARRLDLPKTRFAVTGSSLEPWWPNSAPKIGGWLTAHNYDLTASPPSFTHPQLEALRDVSVFYWQTHSGMADLRALLKDASGKVMKNDAGEDLHEQAFAYMTSTALLADGGTKLTADQIDMRKRKLLTIATVSLVKDQKHPYEFRFGITAQFIRERMTQAFAANSLIAIDSCTGAEPGATAAFKAVNAGAFVSWDNESGNKSQLAFEKLFDRLLGQNDTPTAGVPLERPFPFEAVKTWMQQKGHDLDPSAQYDGGTPARLAFLQFKDFAVLRPTITRVLFNSSSVAEPYPKLMVEGTFGEDPGALGTVFWGGTMLEKVRWSPDHIFVKVPPLGAGYPAGPVVVTVDQRESQPAPLTTWDLVLTYTLTGRGSLKATATLNCLLRSDARGTRWLPEEPVQFVLNNASHLLDSSGTLTAGGAATNPTESWAGGASLSVLPLDQSPTPATNYLSCSGTFERATSQLWLIAKVNASFSKNGGPGGLIDSQIAWPAGIRIDVDWPTRQLKGKTLTGSWPIPGETLVVSWPDTPPRALSLPTDQDPR